MRYKLAILFSLFALSGSAQIVKTAGIPYTATTPSHTPSASGSSWAIDTANLDLYAYYGGAWNLAGERIQTISGCTAPAYTPGKGQSLFVINGCDSLYYYRSGAWVRINAGGGGGAGVTDGDKGDIDVTSSGSVWTIDTSAVTTIKVAANAIDSTKVGDKTLSLSDLNGAWGVQNGSVLKWNGTNWRPASDNTGTDGNGIYSGDGDIPTNTDATLPTNSFLRFEWPSGNTAFIMDDFGDTVYLADPSLASSVLLSASKVGLRSTGNIELWGGTGGAKLRMLEPTGSGTNYTQFQTSEQAADIIYTLPTTTGSNGQYLQFTTGGQLQWSTVAAGVTDGDKGDIDVTGTGATWTVDTSAVNRVKIAADAIDSTKVEDLRLSLSDLNGGWGAQNGSTLKWNGTNWRPASDTDTDAQTLSIDSTAVTGIERFAVSISNGNTVRFDVPQGIFLTDGDKTDITVSSSGATWTIDNGAVSGIKIASNAVDSTKVGDKTLSLSDLNGAWGANAGSVLKWDGNNWRPGTDNNTDAQTLSIDSAIVGSVERFAVAISSGNTVRFDVPQTAGVTDGDKGDIDVTASGATWTIDTSSVTTGKILNATILFEDIGQNSASSGQVIKWNGTAWAAAADNTGGAGSTDLSWTGASSPYTLNSSSGTDVDFAQGGGITLSTSGATLTIAAVDQSTTNELQTLSTATNTVTLSNSGGNFTIAGAGINTVSTNGSTITVTGTENDGSTTNEGSLTVGAGISTTSIINSNTSGSTGVTISASTGLSISEAGSTITLTNSAPDQTVAITGAGISTVTGTYPNFTITSTEVDGSATNEIQNLSLSGQSLGISSGTGVTLPVVGVSAGTGISVSSSSGTVTVTNAAPDQTVAITGAGISTVTGTYPNFTVTSTEADGSASNEGILGVGAGSGTTATITTNTTTGNAVTIAGGGIVAITETTSSNGGTITISGTEVDGSTTNELQTLSTATNTVTLSSSGGSFTISGAGINTASTSGSTITITGTEVDGSTTNEIQDLSLSGQTLSLSSDPTTVTLPVIAVSAGTGISTSSSGGTVTVTNSAPDQTVAITGAGISAVTGTYPNFTITSTEVDGSTTNEIQNLSLSGQSLGISNGTGVTLPVVGVSAGTGISVSSSSGTVTVTNSAPDQTVSITGAGISAVTGTYPNFTVTSTEVDGSTTNELQTITNTSDATSHTVTLSNSGGSVQLIQGTGIDLTTGGTSGAGTVTIAATNSGTVTSVGITAPAAGITVSNSPITGSGNMTLALANDLNAVENLSTNGIAVRTGTDSWTTRSVAVSTDASSTSALGVGFADGVGGNPTISVNTSASTTKLAVVVATTGNITLSGTQSIDGTTLFANNRVLVKNQNTASENGIWVVSSGAWSRATDVDIDDELNRGIIVYVRLGIVNGGKYFRLATSSQPAMVIGTTALTFTEIFNGFSLTDGDKGDIDVTSSGATWTIDTASVTTSKIANATILFEDIAANGAGNGQVIKYNGSAWVAATDETGGGGVSDGDKGDIDVTSSGATWTVDTSAITTIKVASNAIDSSRVGDKTLSLDDLNGGWGAATGTPLEWNGTNWRPGVDSSGIYSGSGNVPDNTIPNVLGYFGFQYDTGDGEALAISNTGGTARMSSPDGNTYALIENDSITIESDTKVKIVANTLDASGVTNFVGFPSGGVTDGDKGDIDVTGSGATWTVDTSAISTIKVADAAVTYAKIQNVAANSVLARVGTTSGTVEAVALGNSNLLGRGTGANNVGAISLGSNLAISLNTLNTTGHPTITGTPTTNAIPKWTSASALGSTIVQESISGADTIIQIVGRDALRLPLGTTAERPGTPTSGMTRYNTTTGAFEYRDGDLWETPLLSATGTGLDTAGRVLFADANGKATGSDKFVWNSTNNQLVVGLSTNIISSTDNIIEIKGSGNTNLGNISYGGRAQWNSARLNGTPASPTALNSGDGISQFAFSAYDGANFQFPAAIRATIDGAVSAGATPTKFEFFTGNNLSGRAQRLSIRSDGRCGFSTDTPENTVQINGTLGRNTPTTVTGNYAVADGVTWLIVNNSASTTITLPSAASWDGRELTIKTIQAQTVISDTSNVVPIDSATAGTAILPATDGAWALLVSNGTNWVIMQRG